MIKQEDVNLKLPEDALIGAYSLPYFFVGDDAFPLSRRLLKPYTPKRNQQLSTEEDRTFQSQPSKVKTIVAACCLLHNFFINKSGHTITKICSYIVTVQ